MIEHEYAIHVNRPVELVFAFLADPENLRSWQSNLVENEQVTQGPLQVGSRFREVRRMGPRQAQVQAEITDWQPNHGFATRTLTMPQVTVSYNLVGEQGGTRLEYKFVMRTRGMLRLMEPLIAGSIKKGSEADFARLKQVLESRPPAVR